VQSKSKHILQGQ